MGAERALLARGMATTTVAAARPRLVTPVFVLITLSTFAYFVSVGALIPTLPLYVEGPLGGGDVAVGLGIGAFSLSAVLLRPFVGRLSDLRGRRLLLVAGAALVTVSVAGYVLVSSLIPLLILRLVTGAGEAFFYVGAASAINDIAPDERRGEALSFFSLALYAGMAIGPILGEAALGVDRYSATWLLAAGAAGVALLLGWKVPDTRPPGVAVGSAPLIHRAALVPGTVLAASVWGLAGFSTFVPLYARELGLEGSSYVFATYSGLVLALRVVRRADPGPFGDSPHIAPRVDRVRNRDGGDGVRRRGLGSVRRRCDLRRRAGPRVPGADVDSRPRRARVGARRGRRDFHGFLRPGIRAGRGIAWCGRVGVRLRGIVPLRGAGRAGGLGAAVRICAPRRSHGPDAAGPDGRRSVARC